MVRLAEANQKLEQETPKAHTLVRIARPTTLHEPPKAIPSRVLCMHVTRAPCAQRTAQLPRRHEGTRHRQGGMAPIEDAAGIRAAHT